MKWVIGSLGLGSGFGFIKRENEKEREEGSRWRRPEARPGRPEMTVAPLADGNGLAGDRRERGRENMREREGE